MKKTLLIIIAIFLVQICQAQVDTANKAREAYSKEFKWRIIIPEGFQYIKSEQYAALKQKGDNALQSASDGKVVDNSTRIISFNSTLGNTFDSNYQLYDSAIYGEFGDNCKKSNNIVFETFKKQMPSGTKMDSTSSTETISSLTFQTFKIKMTLPNNVELTFMMFMRLFDKNEFTVALVFVDKKKGDLILNAWRNSKFEGN